VAGELPVSLGKCTKLANLSLRRNNLLNLVPHFENNQLGETIASNLKHRTELPLEKGLENQNLKGGGRRRLCHEGRRPKTNPCVDLTFDWLIIGAVDLREPNFFYFMAYGK
jgi:hypothetical protein